MTKNSNDSNRFIGLQTHYNSVQLENSPYFNALKRFSSKHENVKNDPQFAGKIESDSIENLGSLKALEIYQKTMRYNRKTAVGSIAEYVFDMALQADLVSMFYQMHPNAKECDLSPFELRMVFSPATRIHLLNMLTEILELKKEKKQDSALKAYCNKLKECLINMERAKKKTLELIKTTGIKDDKLDEKEKIKPLCLVTGLDKWENIRLPNDKTFDLGKNWPLNENMFAYVSKILQTMPAHTKELLALYKHLAVLSQKTIDSKELYRLTILCNVIQWTIQEKTYLECCNEPSDILANQQSKVSLWLRSYQLEAQDFARKPGNCLFDNVIAQIPDCEQNSLELREATVDFMNKRRNKYEKLNYKDPVLRQGNKEEYLTFKNWVEYLKCMKQSEVWATELEIEALAEMLQCPIVLINVGNPPNIYNKDAKKDPIFLHPEDNYFTACFPIKRMHPSQIYQELKKEVTRS